MTRFLYRLNSSPLQCTVLPAVPIKPSSAVLCLSFVEILGLKKLLCKTESIPGKNFIPCLYLVLSSLPAFDGISFQPGWWDLTKLDKVSPSFFRAFETEIVVIISIKSFHDATKNCRSLGGGCWLSTAVAFALPTHPAGLGSILGIPKIFFREKFLLLQRFIDSAHCLVSGQCKRA